MRAYAAAAAVGSPMRCVAAFDLVQPEALLKRKLCAYRGREYLRNATLAGLL